MGIFGTTFYCKECGREAATLTDGNAYCSYHAFSVLGEMELALKKIERMQEHSRIVIKNLKEQSDDR